MEQALSTPTRLRRWVYPTVLVAVFAGCGLLAIAWVYSSFGSFRTAWAYAAGRDLISAQDVIDVGSLSAGETRPFQVVVINSSARNYRVIGSNQLCQCRVLSPLPLDIPAGESATIEMAIQPAWKSSLGDAACAVDYVTDAPSAPLLRQVVRYAVR